MRRYELGMTLDYVSNWGVVDAVREIFQNALDEEIQNPENKWYFNYDRDSEILRIGNKLSKLSAQSLLLGCSSKRNDSSTIGQHGEGYKVAMIVLLRNNCGFRVYNYNEKEIWSAKVINSKRYNTEIPVIDVEKMGLFKQPPENSLVFEITNISESMYSQIEESNLWVQDDLGEVLISESSKAKYGRVLLEERYKGKVFVKGLYVCSKPNLNYGYDLEPSLIKLDRDRGLVDTFNLQFQLGTVLLNTKDVEFIKDVKDKWDGYYIRCFARERGMFDLSEVYDDECQKFFKEHGQDAIPCTDQSEFNQMIRLGLHPVMVTENRLHYISNSSLYSNYVDKSGYISLATEFKEWYNSIIKYLPAHMLNDSSDLYNRVVKRLGE